MNVVFISGALLTAEFWHFQENYFHNSKKFKNIIHTPIVTADIHSFTEHAQTILRNKLPHNFTLIAFSMGCYTALELINIIPERINKLILINGAAKELSHLGKSERERSIQLITNDKFDLLVKLIFKKSIYNKYKYYNLYDQLHKMAQKVGSENYRKQLQLMINKNDQSKILSEINCPTLILTSCNDKIMPSSRSKHLKEKIPDSEIQFVDNCGHLAPLEQPELINQLLINWIKK